MNPVLAELMKTPYQRLPEAIRQFYTEREYLFLTDDQKARLVDSETEPEVG